ncbi:hypothetical protein E2562_003891 [Oryza meyeriana var. granulata]|uniref:Alpha/beta hydrolase fold-3 domain-containing protein n=1 Tax=Oryza meyeriana var. granulata TaxID=110450 RepID=A0A6G1D0M5_9ORYZ|nr:hypothetical protein E2562_003891 [Oryza meyeriana var. granulata]
MQASMSGAATNGHAGGDLVLNLNERFLTSSFVPATRDVVIDHNNGVSARLFLPSAGAAAVATTGGRRLPIVLYFHGGSSCAENAISCTHHRYISSLASRAGALIVSVEYRLAPEQVPIPAAHDDAWAAFRWVESLSDPWLAEYGDRSRTFVAGDRSGGNIAYHTVARASRESDDGSRVEGLIMVHPFFWGPERLPSETVWDGQADNDDPQIDPSDDEFASLTCRRVLMAVAGRDTLRERSRRLASRMRGDVTLVESEGEDHGFHLYSPLRATSKKLMESIAQFINQPSPAPVPARPLRWPETILSELQELSTYGDDTSESSQILLGVPTRAYKAIFVDRLKMKASPAPAPASPMRWPATILSELDEWSTYSDDTTNSSQILLGMPTRAYKATFVDKKVKTGPSSNMAVNASLTIGRCGKASKTSYGIMFGRTRVYNYIGVAAACQCQHPFRGVLW